MKKIYLVFMLNCFSSYLIAQDFNWAIREGWYAYDYGYGVETDANGNIYVAGKYELDANFSGTILSCEGNHDIYAAKYNPDGTLKWIVTAGGESGDYAQALACDGVNYVYVAGEIQGYNTPIKFSNSPLTLTCKGDNDIFLAKYDLDGNLIWALREGGNYSDKALGVTYDNMGNVYICGYFRDVSNFSGTLVPNTGGKDMYVAKYDKDGKFQWVRSGGSKGRDEALAIECDAEGNVYVCGMHSGNAKFDSQTISSPNGYFNTFLAKYSSDGTLQWVKGAGGDYDDVAWDLTIDKLGKIYITGEFNAYAIFDSHALTTTGSANVFVACYNASGNVEWVKGSGGKLIDRARGIGTDGNNIYITGQFGATAYFDSFAVTAADSSDIFIASLNNAGNYRWAIAVGGPVDSVETLSYESGNAICADASGMVYATGALLTGGDFGSTSLKPYSRTDAFLTQISQSDAFPPTVITYDPLDNSVGVQPDENLVITFNEPVQKGSGNIIIKESGVVKQTIPVSGSEVIVAGNTVTIDPPASFTDNSSVNIEMDAGTFKDMTNNDYDGITNVSDWNFTVIDTNPPTSLIETSYSGKFRIFPNPSNGELLLEIDPQISDKGNLEIIIYNSLGQIIQRDRDVSPQSDFNLFIQAKGIYFISVRNEEQSIFRDKIIIH